MLLRKENFPKRLYFQSASTVISCLGYVIPCFCSLSCYFRLLYVLSKVSKRYLPIRTRVRTLTQRLRTVSLQDWRRELLLERKSDASRHIGHLVTFHVYTERVLSHCKTSEGK